MCYPEDDYDDLEPNEDEDEYEGEDDGYDFDPDCTEARDFEEDLIDGVGFADPGGKSALRAATKDNPRNQPCPTCHKPDRLTPADVARGYQCDECAERDEGGGP